MRERNYGIDLLRIIAIFCIVVLHTLRRSGLLQMTASSPQYHTAWLLETAAFFAVDAFGIISGYVNYSFEERPFRLSNLLVLWLQVIFYGVLSVLIFVFFTNVDVTSSDLIKACFPLISNEYWFFTSYAGMFILSPIINKAVRNSDNRSLAILLAICFVFFSLFESLSIKASGISLFALNKGYSFIWLSLMYFTGAAMKKSSIHQRLSKRKYVFMAWVSILLMILLSFSWNICIGPYMEANLSFGSGWNRLLTEYISPTIVIIAVLSVMLFSKFKFNSQINKLISFVAPSAFSVYLLNSQPLIAEHAYNSTLLSFLTDVPAVVIPLYVSLLASAFVVIGVLADRIRIIIFDVLSVKSLLKKIDSYIHITQ